MKSAMNYEEYLQITESFQLEFTRIYAGMKSKQVRLYIMTGPLLSIRIYAIIKW